MIESINELKEICKKKERYDWGVLVNYFYRPISFYFVWLLLHTKISANQVTFLSIIVGITGSSFFLFNNKWFPLFGAIILFFWFLAECCDGSVARYRNVKEGKPFTMFGVCLDWINLRITPYILFVCITLRTFRETRNSAVLFIGVFIIVVWTMMNVTPGLQKFFRIANEKSKNTVIKSVLNFFINFINGFDKRSEVGDRIQNIDFSNQVRHPAIRKIHYYSYILIRLDLLPVWFLVAAIIDIIIKVLKRNINLLGNTLSCVFLTYVLLGILYVVFWILELSQSRIYQEISSK